MPELDAILQSASLLEFCELVVAFDHLLKLSGPSWQRYAIATREEIMAAICAGKVLQARRLRAALMVARVGAESRMESLLHFELARLGIDDLEIQSAVFDAQGKWVGRFDQVDHVKKLILEYDGEQHRTDRGQYLRDEAKLQGAREAGYEIVRLHYEDFFAENLKVTRSFLCEKTGRSPQPLPRELARLFAESPAPSL
ncbi:hypothetical protein ACXR2W_09000 [Leucobacter sp. HY1908]